MQRLLCRLQGFLHPAHPAQHLSQPRIVESGSAPSLVGIEGNGPLHRSQGRLILLLPQIDIAQGPMIGGRGIPQAYGALRRRQRQR